MVLTLSLWLSLATVFGILIKDHYPQEPGTSPDLQVLRKRWGAEDIVRDLDHIKEDLKKIGELQDTGDLDTNEALFYFLRMHDFDNNMQLDGQELMVAMKHSLEHNQQSENPIEFEEIENIVDSFFAYDDNHDGFISYPELRKHLSPAEDTEEEENN